MLILNLSCHSYEYSRYRYIHIFFSILIFLRECHATIFDMLYTAPSEDFSQSQIRPISVLQRRPSMIIEPGG